jgi:hypothetical protein
MRRLASQPTTAPTISVTIQYIALSFFDLSIFVARPHGIGWDRQDSTRRPRPPVLDTGPTDPMLRIARVILDKLTGNDESHVLIGYDTRM